MNVVVAPNEHTGSDASLFLAGGISGCPPWQDVMIDLLADYPGALLNPRRDPWPDDEGVVIEQITWEFRHLRAASGILFWFPAETLCPITLYELGTWSMSDKPLFVGVHPEYRRRLDVEVQTSLVRPGLVITSTLEALADQVLTDQRL